MENIKQTSVIWQFFRALIVSIIITFLLILCFALLIKFCSIDSNYIPIINQIIKSVSVFLSIMLCFRGKQYGWLRGFIFGVIYVAVSFLIFSILSKQFSFGISLLNDVALVGVSGMISGIIAVNVKK